MYKCKKESTALYHAKKDGLFYAMCVFDGCWYVGTVEQLDKIGCLSPFLNGVKGA